MRRDHTVTAVTRYTQHCLHDCLQVVGPWVVEMRHEWRMRWPSIAICSPHALLSRTRVTSVLDLLVSISRP